MARNTTAMKRGFNYDKVNGRMSIMVDGVEAVRLTKSSTGVDIRLLGDTPASNYINFDASGPTLSLVGTGLTIGADAAGTDFTLYGATASASLTWDASDDRLEGVGNARLQIGESTTGVTTAGGSTMIYGYASHGTNALTGELIGVRGNARVNVASTSGQPIGGKFQAGNMSAGYNLHTVRGVYVDVVNKVPSASSATWTNARGFEVSMDLDQGSSGHTNTVTNAYMFYGVYNLPTAGSYATVTNGYGVYIVNEAVGGTGQMLDAAFYAKGINQSGGVVAWDYGMMLYDCRTGIYLETTGMTQAMKFDDDQTVASDDNQAILVDIKDTANAGFLKVLVGSSSTRYIALYETKTS